MGTIDVVDIRCHARGHQWQLGLNKEGGRIRWCFRCKEVEPWESSDGPIKSRLKLLLHEARRRF